MMLLFELVVPFFRAGVIIDGVSSPDDVELPIAFDEGESSVPFLLQLSQ